MQYAMRWAVLRQTRLLPLVSSHPQTPRLFIFCSCSKHTRSTLVNLVCQSESTSAVTLLGNAELHTLALGERDPWLLTANDEDVSLTCGELVVNGVLDVDNVEASIVTLTVGDDTNTTHVATTGGHGDHTSVEADEVINLA